MTKLSVFVHSHRLSLIAALLSLAFMVPAQAEDFTFSIGPQDLSAALKLFAVQSHREIFFAPEVARGKKSKGIKGTLDDIKALKAILEGTGLNFSVTASNAILVNDSSSKSGASQVGASTTSGSAPANSGNPTRLAQSNTTNSQSAANASGPQNSQDVPANSLKTEDSKGLAEILVKGSRIMNVDVTRTADDPQPYYIFDSQAIEQSGAADLDDFLKQRLTMNTTFASNNQFANNRYGNTSSIDLRGLGANETLILIDGRRSASVTYGDAPGQPDINGIPIAAIDRIEVLPSSASAIYGGSAVGGVVNIILKKNFNGGDVRVNYENTFGADAPLRTVSGVYGFSLKDGTQIMLSGHYSDGTQLELQDRLNLVQRGISTILSNNPSYLYNAFQPFNGGTTTNIASGDFSTYPIPQPLVLKNGTSLNSPITYIPVGAAPGSNISAGLLANAGKYSLTPAPGIGEFGLQSAIGAVPTTKSVMGTVRRELTSWLDAFVEFSAEGNASHSYYDAFPSGYVPSTAPDDPFKQAVSVSFPTTSSQAVTSDSKTESATGGLLARFPADWRSEFDYTWSNNSYKTQDPQRDYGAFNAALANGTLNPFVDTIAYPLNLTPYIANTYTAATATLSDFALRASGPVGSLPAGKPALTFGLEHRLESFRDSSFTEIDPATPRNDVEYLYFGQPATTDSIYAEALIPLVASSNNIPLIHSLDLQLAGRSERYTVHLEPDNASYTPEGVLIAVGPGNATTVRYTSTNPTIALKYKPVEDLMFRASFAKAFLPPTPSQLLPNYTQYPGNQISDPKFGGLLYNVPAIYGGNPNLQPQRSKDWDIGLVWEPQEAALKGIRMDLEYYKITQPNYIILAPPQSIVSDPAYASRVTRDPTTGLITLINDSYINADLYVTQGWDLSIDYRKPTNIGTFDLHAVGTMVVRDQRQYSVGSPLFEYAGYPQDGGEAKIKANLTLSWEYRRWLVGWTTTYVGSYYQIYSPGSPILITSGPCGCGEIQAQGGNSISSQSYQTLFGSYSFATTSSGGIYDRVVSGVKIQFGIKNVFNKLPPFDVQFAPYYYSPYGDARLRDYWLNVSKSF